MDRKKFLFLIEDDPSIRESLSEVLQDEGYSVESVPNGKEALEWLTSAKRVPALILLDMMMPVMDGFGFREAQLKDPAIAQIPVVMFSADPNLNQKALAMGVSEFVKKPVDLFALFDLAKKYCG